MDPLQYTIHKKRNDQRRRRNVTRRISLVVFILIFGVTLYQIYLIPQQNSLKVNLELNNLVNTEFVNEQISNYINNKNFFLLSPKELSKNLIGSCNLLKEVVVRKYIFPDYRLNVYLVEKEIWGKLTLGLQNTFYITHEGDLVDPMYVVKDRITNELLPVDSVYLEVMNPVNLVRIKKVFEMINKKIDLNITNIAVTGEGKLEIFSDNNLKIIVGEINDNIMQRASRLKEVIELVREKDYLVEYIDLTLENSVVFKKQKEKDRDKNKIKIKLLDF